MVFEKRQRRWKGVNKRHRPCRFCVDKVKDIDYKDSILGRYLSDRGKILSRRVTKICAKHQRQLSLSIKRARFLALLPYINK